MNDEQYERCLKKMQEYVEKNKGREARKYERGAGVRTRDDRVGGGCRRYGSELEQYNGKEGGKVFRWYSRAVFNNYLARMGASEGSCTEKQCMVALGATSDELRKYPMVTEHLKPFAGPQCFPHIDSSSLVYRGHANERRSDDPDAAGKSSQPDGQETGAVSAVLNEKCWLQCMKCKKWRCVSPGCLASLRGEGFGEVRGTDLDWGAWLAGAAERYAAAEALFTGGNPGGAAAPEVEAEVGSRRRLKRKTPSDPAPVAVASAAAPREKQRGGVRAAGVRRRRLAVKQASIAALDRVVDLCSEGSSCRRDLQRRR